MDPIPVARCKAVVGYRPIRVGQTYQACGVTNANGWILIQDFKNEYGHGDGWSGYIPSVCTTDGV